MTKRTLNLVAFAAWGLVSALGSLFIVHLVLIKSLHSLGE